MFSVKNKLSVFSLVLFSTAILFGCQTSGTLENSPIAAENKTTVNPTFLEKAKSFAQEKTAKAIPNASAERDNIFMLLAYSVVYKDWQNANMKNNRGYNIGSILVNEKEEVIYWARNSVNVTNNKTQHGEVRLINCYLANNERNDMEEQTIYTTLEPCAMCSGMMFLTSLPRTVYGQKDPSFGDAIERLNLNSNDSPSGYPPYPRQVISDASKLSQRYLLDFFYASYIKEHKDPSITDFLTTPEAEFVYRSAFDELKNFQVKYSENHSIKEQALEFYNSKVADKYTKLCPDQ
ncbi:nucleoside deaminase [Pseudomonadota bacterium]